MATTSFLYHTMGLVDYKHLKTEYREGKVLHHVEKVLHKRTCKNCKAPWHKLKMDGQFERSFIGIPVGQKRQEVVLHGHIQCCMACGKRLREPISFAEGSTRYLKALGRLAVALCGITQIKNVANFLGVGWDLVKDAFKSYLKKSHKKRPLDTIEYIAVDEFATHKGHKYMTVVLDLKSGEILHAQEGKDAAALAGFLRELKKADAPIKAIAADMSEAFASAIREVFGDTVDLVNDPFHVTMLASKAIDETRRDLYRELKGNEKETIKGSRFLLLKGWERLKPEGVTRLTELLAANEPLYKAYMLKEDMRMFWLQPNEKAGELFLNEWIKEAKSIGNKHFEKLASTLDSHRHSLLSYFRHQITTGPLEGLNNKIKVLKRQAYGFRDMEFFKLRLYFLHKTPLMMAG